jgi:hypothetical protein
MPIVTSTYRYKPPPRNRKPIAIEAPAIVTPADPNKMRRPAARRKATPQPANDDGKTATSEQRASKSAIVTAQGRKTVQQQQMATLLAADQPKRSAIVTARKPGKAIPHGLLPDTPEERDRRGAAADAMFQQFKRLIAAGVKKP